MDPVRTFIRPTFPFVSRARFVWGAAKRVRVNPRNYRHYVRGDIIFWLAGSGTNRALFALGAVMFAFVGTLAHLLPGLAHSLGILQRMMFWGMYLNLVLACSNLIPVPPLDGSHVLKQLLPPAAGMRYRQLYALGIVPILLVMWLLPGVIAAFMWPGIQLLGFALRMVFPLALPGAIPGWFLM